MQTHLKILQRKLRNNMPAPEQRLWYYIRNKQLGVRFRRQYVIEDYILDFYSPECHLCIELDGNTHFMDESSMQKDFLRDDFLRKNNIKVLRFLNTDIGESIDGVINKIKEVIKSPL